MSKKEFLPIIFFEIYIIFTMLLFEFGPIQWDIPNKAILYTFLIGIQLSLYLGYKSGFNTKTAAQKKIEKAPEKLISIAIIVSLIMLLPSLYLSNGGSLNSDMFTKMINPSYAYTDLRESVTPRTSISYFIIILSPLTWSLLPWIIFYWSELSLKTKVFGGMVALAYGVLPYLVSGTNKGLFDFIFILIFCSIARHVSYRKNTNFFNVKKIVAYTLLASGILYYFYINISGRTGNKDSVEYNISRADNARTADYLIESNVSDELKVGSIMLTSYIVQGYYGCSLAMQEGFEPTYGLGNSRFFSWLIGEKVFNVNVQPNTYVERAGTKSNWDAYINWWSIYAFFASDVTFYGNFVIFFFVGKLLSMSWLSVIRNRNKWGLVMFCLLVILLFYSPANNQIFQTGTTAITFLYVLVVWLNKYKLTL